MYFPLNRPPKIPKIIITRNTETVKQKMTSEPYKISTDTILTNNPSKAKTTLILSNPHSSTNQENIKENPESSFVKVEKSQYVMFKNYHISANGQFKYKQISDDSYKPPTK